jgi:hypothetical protein
MCQANSRKASEDTTHYFTEKEIRKVNSHEVSFGISTVENSYF